MGSDAWLEIFKNLVIVGPWWAILGILAFRSPQLVKEFFAGLSRGGPTS